MSKAFYFLQSGTNAINTINQRLNKKSAKNNATLMEKMKKIARSQMSFFVICPYAHLGNFRTTAGCLLKDCQV